MAKGFTFLKWNKKYGTNAQFVVKDNSTDKQSLFSPARPSDLTWVDKDISKDGAYKEWDDFGNEQVENLNEVVF